MDQKVKKVPLGDMINETFNAMFTENKKSFEKTEDKKKKKD